MKRQAADPAFVILSDCGGIGAALASVLQGAKGIAAWCGKRMKQRQTPPK